MLQSQRDPPDASYQRDSDALTRGPIVSILGPRQSGKTTLARAIARGRATTFCDLERPSDVARLSSPMTALEPLRGLVVIDEVQRMPSLLEILCPSGGRA